MSKQSPQFLTCDPIALRRAAAELEQLRSDLMSEMEDARPYVYVDPPGLDYVSKMWAEYLNGKTDEWYVDANAYLAELESAAALLRRNAADFEAQEVANAEGLLAGGS